MAALQSAARAGAATPSPPAVAAGSGFDQHPAAHFEVQRVAEMGAVAPVDARLVGLESDRLGFLRVDDEVDVVVLDAEAVRQIFDLVEVGQRSASPRRRA